MMNPMTDPADDIPPDIDSCRRLAEAALAAIDDAASDKPLPEKIKIARATLESLIELLAGRKPN